MLGAMKLDVACDVSCTCERLSTDKEPIEQFDFFDNHLHTLTTRRSQCKAFPLHNSLFDVGCLDTGNCGLKKVEILTDQNFNAHFAFPMKRKLILNHLINNNQCSYFLLARDARFRDWKYKIFDINSRNIGLQSKSFEMKKILNYFCHVPRCL